MRIGRLIAPSVLVLAGVVLSGGLWRVSSAQESKEEKRLVIVWTSADPEVAHRMAFMYLHASQRNGWFNQNRLIVWGPSARLLAGDKDLQAKVKQMQTDGVVVEACVVCSDSYGVSEELRALGITVQPMGKPLSELIQSGWHILTF